MPAPPRLGAAAAPALSATSASAAAGCSPAPVDSAFLRTAALAASTMISVAPPSAGAPASDAAGPSLPRPGVLDRITAMLTDARADKAARGGTFIVHYVLTVPAGWDELGKSIMRRAAEQAGEDEDI